MDASKLDQRILLEGWSLHQRIYNSPQNAKLCSDQTLCAWLARWREIVGPINQDNFEKRLSWDGLASSDIAWALNPPEDAVPKTPAWWSTLALLRKAWKDVDKDDRYRMLAKRCRDQPFVDLWIPPAVWALNQLIQKLSAFSPQVSLSRNAWIDLAEPLLQRLCNITERAVWNIYNQRRSPGQIFLAYLQKSSDIGCEIRNELYDCFISELLDSGYSQLLDEFPVLGRLLAVVTEQWIEVSREMLMRIGESRSELLQSFAIGIDAKVINIKSDLSDPHRGGRSVSILAFDCAGRQKRVVYKPKAMNIDAAYFGFLRLINDLSEMEPIQILTVLPRDGYGFMEWVDHCPCKSDMELSHFYKNAGRIMAICYMLGCTDCHHENLIASKDQLILIDTETLFEAEHLDSFISEGYDSRSLSSLQKSLQDSVLRSGFLPRWQTSDKGRNRPYDISALGIQPPPFEREIPGWVSVNSDGMIASRIMKTCDLPNSLPVSLGSRERLTDFVDELCSGFTCQLNVFLKNSKAISEYLNCFKGLTRRFVVRSTRVYFMIQQQMLEPESLRTANAHGIKIEQLSRAYLLSKHFPSNWAFLQSEINQIERLDIPFFEHKIDTTWLDVPETDKRIHNFFKRSGLLAAKNRFKRLCEEEIDFQTKLVRGAVAAKRIHASSNLEASSNSPSRHKLDLQYTLKEPVIGSNGFSKTLLDEATRLAQQLWEEAIIDKSGRAEWLGVDIGADAETFQFGLVGNSLYSGCTGIALLFSSLASITKGRARLVWQNRARACVKSLLELGKNEHHRSLHRLVRDQPCGLAGTGGLLLCLSLLRQANIQDTSLLISSIIECLRPEWLSAELRIDIMGGLSGLIGPLLITKHPLAFDLASICGERICELQLDNGGWLPASASSGRRNPLTGFSHGAAGISAALATLSSFTNNQRLHEPIRRGLQYERSVFNHDRANWPDLRRDNNSCSFMLSWCHGAPGVLLARHILRKVSFADSEIADEIKIARNSTLEKLIAVSTNAFRGNASLCCGFTGLTSLLRIDSRLCSLDLDTLIVDSEKEIANIAKCGREYSFYELDGGVVNIPGLFNGKAGVALAFIEAATNQTPLPIILSSGMLAD